MKPDDVKELLNFYQKFPEKNDFVPLVGDDKITFFYSGDSGLKKSIILSDRFNIEPAFIESEKDNILKILEDISGISDNGEHFTTIGESDEIQDILSASYQDAPIINLVNQIIIDAVKADASDIHFENVENSFNVRYRIDGMLNNPKIFKKGIHDQIIARIKVMSMLDVSETRKPQDGRINLKIGNRSVDMRVSTIPSTKGEKCVLRILEKTKGLVKLDNMGIPNYFTNTYKNYISRPNGIILVTGPTGSGKTTTLYASLLEIDRTRKNIVTIEDPVEYEIEGITQVQVNPAVNLNFPSAIRSFLRQDPDVMLVGEIRDEETAKAAIQASLTGHLVFSTLHTNDAPTAITRLIEMNVEPFLVSSSLLLVVGQRLIRKNCEKCKEKISIDSATFEIFKDIKLDFSEYYVGKGCDECMGTGYKGRMALFEFLEINDEIRRLINQKTDSETIARTASKLGYKRLLSEGLKLVKSGLTSIQEVVSVTKFD